MTSAGKDKLLLHTHELSLGGKRCIDCYINTKRDVAPQFLAYVHFDDDVPGQSFRVPMYYCWPCADRQYYAKLPCSACGKVHVVEPPIHLATDDPTVCVPCVLMGVKSTPVGRMSMLLGANGCVLCKAMEASALVRLPSSLPACQHCLNLARSGTQTCGHGLPVVFTEQVPL